MYIHITISCCLVLFQSKRKVRQPFGIAEIFLQLQERRIRDQLLHLIMAAATIIIIIIIVVVISVILFIFISVIVTSVVDILALFEICLFLLLLQRVLVFKKCGYKRHCKMTGKEETVANFYCIATGSGNIYKHFRNFTKKIGFPQHHL
jgi:hypothetical protein